MTTNPDSSRTTPRSPADAEPSAAAFNGRMSAAVGSAMVGTAVAFRTRLKVKAQSNGASATAHAETAIRSDGAASTVTATRSERQDDLTEISGISSTHHAALIVLGYPTFESIAAWRRDDVRLVAQTLGVGRTISRQNWIEQAALLMSPRTRRPDQARSRLDWRLLVGRGPTGPSIPAVDAGRETVASTTARSQPATDGFAIGARPPAEPADRPASSAAPSPLSVNSGLELIRGIDHGTEAMLRAAGITRASAVAAWSHRDIQVWRNRLGAGKRISTDGWIEQAAVLAAGRDTAYARRLLDYAAIELIRRPRNMSEGQAATGADPSLLARLSATTTVTERRPDGGDRSSAITTLDTARAPAQPPVEDVTVATALQPLPPLPLSGVSAAGTTRCDVKPTAASISFGLSDLETDDVVIITRDKADRPRPANLVPKRQHARDVGQGDARPISTLTARIEILGQSRPPGPARSTPAIDDGCAATRPLDLSSLDAMDEEFPQLSVGEADVQIVRSSTSAAAVGAMAARTAARARTAEYRTSALSDRLVRTAIEPGSYAAYRDEVVEASVEIVPVATARAGETAADDVAAGRPRGEGMQRFFNALAGNGSNSRAK